MLIKLYSRFRGRIVKSIYSNQKLYILYRTVKGIRSDEYYRLIHGYYETANDYTSLTVEHLGGLFPDSVVYYISMGTATETMWGFFALMAWVLDELSFADFLGFVPVVCWGDKVFYHDCGKDSETANVFEYYFKPVSGVPQVQALSSRNVVRAQLSHGAFVHRNDGYRFSEEKLNAMGDTYKRHIHLNDETKEYIDSSIGRILGGKKTLGVHIRGSDFKQQFQAHPIAISDNEFLEKTRELFDEGDYDQVFLATDDSNSLRFFSDVFGDKLKYYDDVIRSENEVMVVFRDVERPLHQYKLGLEVLRDVYTLANCDGFIGSLSNVSSAVRYVNIALDKRFERVIILDKGINTDGIELKFAKKAGGVQLIVLLPLHVCEGVAA